MSLLRTRAFFLSILFILLLSSLSFSQHLYYIGVENLSGSSSPNYGYGQFFSISNRTATNYLYVCNGNRISIYNATPPDNISFNRYYTSTTLSYFQFINDGNNGYSAVNTAGIRTYNMAGTNYPSPTQSGSQTGANDAQNMVKFGNYLYVAGGYYGMRTVNVTTLNSPTVTATYNDGTGNWNSIDANNNLVVCSHDNGFKVFTKTNPAQPALAASIDTLNVIPIQLHLEGNRLYMQVNSGTYQGILVWDVSVPIAPVLIARLARYPTSYCIDGNYMYLGVNVGTNQNRIITYDISNLNSITPVDSFYQSSGQIVSMYRNDYVLYAMRTDGTNRDLLTFDLLGSVAMTTPAGNDTLFTGDSLTIAWTGTRLLGAVTIEINRNYPSGTWEYVGTATYSDLQFPWQITGPASTNTRFRVRSLTYPQTAETAANTAVLDRSLTYLEPAAGATRYIGDADTVRWSQVGLTGNVRVEYNNNYPAGLWQIIGSTAASNQRFIWTLTGTPVTNFRYRISSIAYPTLMDSTSGNLTLAARTITVTSPNAVEYWYIYDTTTVRWTSANVTGNVVVELNTSYPTGTFNTIGTVAASAGQLSYPVPAGSTTTTARVRIRSVSYPIATDISDTNFRISSRAINMSKPIGGEVFNVLSGDTIKWSVSNVPGNVLIEMNRNFSSGAWETIGTFPSSQQIVLWNITGPVTTNARIRIRAVNYPWIYRISSTSFTIRANPSVSYNPATLTYSGIPVGTTSSNQTVAVASRSQLSIKALTFTHNNPRFTVTLSNSDSTATGTDSLRFRIAFTPDSIASVYDTLNITFSSPYTAIAIPLTGTGNGAYFRVATSTVSFDLTEAGNRTSQNIMLANTGNVSLTPVTATGANADFTVTMPADPTIPANGSVSASINFQPQGAGTKTATFKFIANGVDIDTFTVEVTGSGKTTPQAPANLIVNTAVDDASLSWSPVTQSVNNFPVSVARYLVLFNASNPYNEASYYFLTFTTSATVAQHLGVVRHSPSMHYQVKAWLGDGDTFDRIIRNIPQGTPASEVLNQLSAHGTIQN